MSDSDGTAPRHLGGREREGFAWNWGRENPVEIVLVAFIIVLYFALPRYGCGIDKVERTEAEGAVPVARDDG